MYGPSKEGINAFGNVALGSNSNDNNRNTNNLVSEIL
jgi:hypothetical protein